MILFISVSLLVYYNKHRDDYINREFDRRLGKVERNSSLNRQIRVLRGTIYDCEPGTKIVPGESVYIFQKMKNIFCLDRSLSHFT